jgi:hypothetical protein
MLGAEKVGSLDTLAQLRFVSDSEQLDARRLLEKRARAKYMTVPLAVTLAELRTELEQSYRNTIYCASTLRQPAYGDKLQGKYCGTRWCLICNRVRTARAINRYEAPLKGWGERWFVTLTQGPTVVGADLKGALDEMQRACRRVVDRIRKGDGLAFRALRKLECTARPGGLFHPHYHLVVDSRRAADLLVSRWLKQFPDASPLAQHIRPCDEGSLREVFKYFTKLVTRLDGRAIAASAPALDVIFTAMRGKRVYQPLGFRVASEVDEEAEIGTDGDTAVVSVFGRDAVWQWDQHHADWVEHSTGEVLSHYEPSPRVSAYVTQLGEGQGQGSSPIVAYGASVGVGSGAEVGTDCVYVPCGGSG